jgi:xanthine/CO dehydrogenase XdhC/CoxF family maturation factor
MQELKQLLKAIDEVQRAGKRAAIATVVRVKGSAYRREGTKMLIDADGNQVCMISGGCLEGEVAELAKQVMASGEGVVQFFELDEDVVWGLGLGCGGKVDVYIEPLDDSALYRRWLELVRMQRFAALATVIETSANSAIGKGARLLVADDGAVTGSLGDAALEAQVQAWVAHKRGELYPRAQTLPLKAQNGETVSVFVDLSVPPAELVLFGAGHDAIPMAQFGHTLGFRVTVVDARHAYVTSERFPSADRLIRSHPSGFAEQVVIGPRSYAIIMNHHLERDAASFAFAIQSPAPYIGVLGPKDRYADILARLSEQGVTLGQADLGRVYNPIGVDIGAETPEEIAVSVMAELLAVRGGYAAGFLRARDGKIHQPAAQERTL